MSNEDYDNYYLVIKKFISYTETRLGKLSAHIFIPYTVLDKRDFVNVSEDCVINYTAIGQYLYVPNKTTAAESAIPYDYDSVIASIVPYPPPP